MKNRLGIYYGYFVQAYSERDDRFNWPECVRMSSAAGLSCLEMSAVRLSDESPAVRQDIVSQAGDLEITLCLATALPPDGDVSSASPDVQRKGIESIKRNIELADKMKIRSISGIIYGLSSPYPPGATGQRGQRMAASAAALREAAQTAEDFGIILGLEAVNRFESPIVNTAAEAMELMRMIDHPAVGIHLDTFHMNIEEDDLSAAISAAGQHLVHFHVSENNRRLPGQSHLDWPGIFAALRRVDYKGAIVIETLPYPYGTMSDRLRIWRNMAGPDSLRSLAESAGFLKSQMENAERTCHG